MSFADGTPFDEAATYNVAMTSYRANGGGGILKDGAGIDTSNIAERVVARYPEIREMLYDFILRHGMIDSKLIGDPSVVGSWKFTPEDIAGKYLDADMQLMFGEGFKSER